MIIFGVIAFGVIFLSFFDETALRLSPVCISVAEYRTECSLCGMTRSFVAISNFDISKSLGYNRAGAALYSIFVINCVFAIKRLYIIYNKKKK